MSPPARATRPRTENGVSHFLEHMAFKGTERRTAAADRRGDRGGRRPHQRLHRARADRVLRQGAEGGHRAGRRHHRRHPDPLHLRAGGAGARARRDPAGDRPGQRHAGRHHLRPSSRRRRSRRSRSAARCWAREDGIKGDAARHADRLHEAALRGVQRGGGRRRQRWSTSRSSIWCGSISPTCRRDPAAEDDAGALSRAANSARTATWTRCTSCWASPPSAMATRTTTRRCCSRRCWAAGCRRGCSRRCGRSAGWSIRSTRSARRTWMAGCSASTPAPARARPRN